MIRRPFLTILILFLSLGVRAQSLQGKSVGEIAAMADSVYMQLSEEEQAYFMETFWYQASTAEREFRFVRAAQEACLRYHFLLRRFGEQLTSRYWEEDSVLMAASKGTGSNALCKNVQFLKASHNEYSDRVSWSFSFGNYGKFRGREYKAFDVTRMQPVVDLLRYPDAYAYLAEKDDTLSRQLYDGVLGWSSTPQKTTVQLHQARQLLEEKKRTIGPQHPCYALTLGELAMVYSYQQEPDFSQAISLQTEALEIFRKAGCQEACQLATRQLSQIIFLQGRTMWYHSEKMTGRDWCRQTELLHRELAVTVPLLGENAPEVQLTRRELERWEYNRKQYVVVDAWKQIKCTYDSLSDTEQTRLRQVLKKRFQLYRFELDHHYVRAAMVARQLYNELIGTFGTADCDTVFHYFKKGYYNSSDTVKIEDVIRSTINDLLSDNSNMSYRVGRALGQEESRKYDSQTMKQFDVLAAQPILDAHQYKPRYAYLACQDDSIAEFIRQGKLDAGINLAERLLAEKRRTIGTARPAYALTLSDLACLYRRKGTSSSREMAERSEFFTKAKALETEAMGIYEKARLPQCQQLSAKFFSDINDKMISLGDRGLENWPQAAIDSFAVLKRAEIATIQPVLGDSALEMVLARAELYQLENRDSMLLGRRHEVLLDSLFLCAIASYREGRYDEALQQLATLKKKEEYRYLPVRATYTDQWMAACYLQMGDTARAQDNDTYYTLEPIDRTRTLELDYLHTFEPGNPRFLRLARDSFGVSSTAYIRMLLRASEQFVEKEQYARAAELALQAKTLCRELLGTGDPVYAQLLQRLGSLYMSTGFYQEAAQTFEESLTQQARSTGRQSPAYQLTLRRLVTACDKAYDYQAVAQWTKERLDTDTTLTSEDRYKLMENIAYALTEKKNGQNPDSVQVLQAIDYFKQAIALRQADLAAKYPLGIQEEEVVNRLRYINGRGNISKSYVELLNCYLLLGRPSRLEDTEKECLSWLLEQRAVRQGHRFATYEDIHVYRQLLRNLTVIYYRLGLEYLKAHSYGRMDTLMAQAQDIAHEIRFVVSPLLYDDESVYTPDQNVINILKSIAENKLGRHEACVATIQNALRLKEEMDGQRKFTYYTPYEALMRSLLNLGRKEEAADYLIDYWQSLSTIALTDLAVKNGPQREQYWNDKKNTFEQKVPRLALMMKEPQTFGMLYDNALLCKGLLLNTEMEIGRLIAQGGDQAQVSLFQQLRQSQLLLMSELQKPRSHRQIDTDSLQVSIRTQEHSLLNTLQQSKSADIVQSLRTSWTDVRQHLRKGDVAVEFVTFPLTADSTIYAALTLRRGYDRPRLTILFNQKELRDLDPDDYYGSTQLYDMLWKPLAEELHNARNIYFSPIGKLHQIGIEYLPGMEAYNTYRLSSTRELTLPAVDRQQHLEAALYGGLKFELTDDERASITPQTAATAFRDTPDLSRLRELRGSVGEMPVLEGSLREVHDIDSLMRENSISVVTAMGTTGTEESFKALSGRHKSIIHVSTHGFYQADTSQDEDAGDDFGAIVGGSGQAQTQEDRSLSRSGLLMTGAADFIYGRAIDADVDDGILTAREISRLDLRGLDLVVLSACETGLGDISGEGVFGLQRGFKKAGAQTLLVSLWEVEDDATQLLMTEFYRNLLAGHGKRQSFLEAQRVLRQAEGGRFNRYECWAAFVMIDALQ